MQEAATAAIRDAILAGVFLPGDRLRQEHLARELMVSRVPVAAALRALETEGLVESVPHRGATVRIVEPAEVDEIYRLRVVLESFALRSAVGRITAVEVEELADLAQQSDEAGDGEGALVLTDQLYDRLYTIGNCPLTADIVRRLRANVGRYWRGLRVVPHDHSPHRVLVDAIRSGDSARGEEWIASHLAKVSSELQHRIVAYRSGTGA